MAGLFSKVDLDKINQIAKKSLEAFRVPEPPAKSKNIVDELRRISKLVLDYFKGHEVILIDSEAALSEYVDGAISAGYCGID